MARVVHLYSATVGDLTSLNIASDTAQILINFRNRFSELGRTFLEQHIDDFIHPEYSRNIKLAVELGLLVFKPEAYAGAEYVLVGADSSPTSEVFSAIKPRLLIHDDQSSELTVCREQTDRELSSDVSHYTKPIPAPRGRNVLVGDPLGMKPVPSPRRRNLLAQNPLDTRPVPSPRHRDMLVADTLGIKPSPVVMSSPMQDEPICLANQSPHSDLSDQSDLSQCSEQDADFNPDQRHCHTSASTLPLHSRTTQFDHLSQRMDSLEQKFDNLEKFCRDGFHNLSSMVSYLCDKVSCLQEDPPKKFWESNDHKAQISDNNKFDDTGHPDLTLMNTPRIGSIRQEASLVDHLLDHSYDTEHTQIPCVRLSSQDSAILDGGNGDANIENGPPIDHMGKNQLPISVHHVKSEKQEKALWWNANPRPPDIIIRDTEVDHLTLDPNNVTPWNRIPTIPDTTMIQATQRVLDPGKDPPPLGHQL